MDSHFQLKECTSLLVCKIAGGKTLILNAVLLNLLNGVQTDERIMNGENGEIDMRAGSRMNGPLKPML